MHLFVTNCTRCRTENEVDVRTLKKLMIDVFPGEKTYISVHCKCCSNVYETSLPENVVEILSAPGF